MDYEKLYKDALKKVSELYRDYNNVSNMIDVKEELETIFPELKESEDEKIRKWIIDDIRYNMNNESLNNSEYKKEAEKAIAWLEKQSKQENLCDKCRKEHPSHSCQDITELGRCYIETINTSSNKVEPMFKIGDYVVVNINGFVLKILGVCSDLYETTFLQSGEWRIYDMYVLDNNAHLWTIQDAKDGDVLFHSDSASNGIFIFKEILQCGTIQKVVCYCDYDSEDGFCLGEKHTCCWTNSKILHPATKEQRDLLFKKMKEAGYEFDFEKKEFKKI